MARRSMARHKFEKIAVPDDSDVLADYGEANALKKANAKGCDQLLELLIKHHGPE